MAATDTPTGKLDSAATASAPVPKRIVNAQTVCNQKNEKGKLCNGHLKQLGTAGEPAQVHLRGDDVLSKCQTCGTLYMGPPLGHVRDPNKQVRFVEAELTALLQAAGGTLPVVQKNERGVWVMLETEAPGHGRAPAAPAAKPAAAPKAAAPAAAKPAAPAAPAKPAEHKTLGQNPNRQLFKRSTYAGVADTGPVAGETFEQKVARLKAVSAGAKQRQEEGGGPSETVVAAPAAAAPVVETEAAPAAAPSAPAAAPSAPAAVPSTPAASAGEHKPTGDADRTLMKRSTYCGVVDTGPVAGETFEQKVARLAALSAAAKQRSEGG
ncbi:MAG TPA: hypothetical protein VL907_09300 [Pyrinomonadaceae bacterium]|jgi:hypothetical protein|nr:hypothetical protein [Pyrinomonadaceae bacterium]